MKIDKTYEGREHSYIKHELLKVYLETLLSIVGNSGTREFTYIDCFAGPWGSDDDNLEGTSISISLSILAKVRETLASKYGTHRLKFNAIYVEENGKRYRRLSEYLKQNSPEGIDTHPLRGDYWDRQDEILRLCGQQSFAFFFIDPKGWLDVSIPKLMKLLLRPKSEFLITFMYDFLNRFLGMDELHKQVSEMLGHLTDQDYQMIPSLTPKERENFVVRKYREALKAAANKNGGRQSRSYHAVVLHKDKNRTLYHMVYLTGHHKGIVKFAQASEKVDFLQQVVRIQRKQNSDPQLKMFSAEHEADRQDGMRANIEDVKKYWLEKLVPVPIRYGESDLADMLEETGWLVKDFQTAFTELLSQNKVENLDAVGKRSKHPVHFGKDERLRRCE